MAIILYLVISTALQSAWLATLSRQLTVRAYKTGGITADAELVDRLKAKRWPRRRYRHYVFARAGGRCHRCESTIAKEAISSRRIYICHRCQPLTSLFLVYVALTTRISCWFPKISLSLMRMEFLSDSQ